MIREIDVKDIDECVGIIKTSFLTVAEEFGITEQNAPKFTAFSITGERLLQQFKSEHKPMYAFYDGSRIVGYYSLTLQDNNGCELNNLCVIPEYRHKKIGEQLLNHAFETARQMNCSKMNIGIVEENQKLRKWYEKQGFNHVGTKKFDFFPFTCGYMEKQL